jgi:hypothetical protein
VGSANDVPAAAGALQPNEAVGTGDDEPALADDHLPQRAAQMLMTVPENPSYQIRNMFRFFHLAGARSIGATWIRRTFPLICRCAEMKDPA